MFRIRYHELRELEHWRVFFLQPLQCWLKMTARSPQWTRPDISRLYCYLLRRDSWEIECKTYLYDLYTCYEFKKGYTRVEVNQNSKFSRVIFPGFHPSYGVNCPNLSLRLYARLLRSTPGRSRDERIQRNTDALDGRLHAFRRGD